MTNSYRQPFKGDYGISLDYNEIWEPLYPPGKPHKGIDYLTPSGTEILASNDGIVLLTGEVPTGYGKFVMLNHAGGIVTIYAHLSEIKVRQGQQIEKGQVIGLSGSTGNSTGAHLHFEMRENNTPIDPKTKLQNVFDTAPIISTPTAVKTQFETVHAGPVIVVADVVNARCHCDMSDVKDQLHKGDIISVGEEVTEYMNLPYRDFWDPHVNCWLRIAEHDPVDQLIKNCELF